MSNTPCTVNEKDSFDITFRCVDPDGDLVVPSSMAYQIDDITTGEVILASTAITPASTGTIEITTLETTLEDQENRYEMRRVAVTYAYGVNKQITRHAYYKVINVGSIT